jgi:uncharacterized protein YecE (DUF72 family)
MASIRIGISGWRYAPWRGVFYPPDLAQRQELSFASRALSSIEINGSFYALQRPESYAAWHKATPPDFLFSVKANRYITHILRLNEVEKPLANFFASGVLQLKEKLGPFLWQFPPSFAFDPARMERFLGLLPRTTGEAVAMGRHREARMRGRTALAGVGDRPLRHAVEIRHPSFIGPAFFAMLRRHGVALVTADTAGKWPYSEEATADFRYARLHGDEEIYASGYTEEALGRWAARFRAWAKTRDIYCYFDNDVKVKAPFDARRLIDKLGLSEGLAPLAPPPQVRKRPRAARAPQGPDR